MFIILSGKVEIFKPKQKPGLQDNKNDQQSKNLAQIINLAGLSTRLKNLPPSQLLASVQANAGVSEDEQNEYADLDHMHSPEGAVYGGFYLGQGECLGEMALITDGKRTASATALCDCQLAVLTKESFDQIFQQFLENLQLKVRVLANLFANIPKNQLVKLSYHFEEKNYQKNSYIFKEGEEAEKVYLLKRGQIHLLKEIPLLGTQSTDTDFKSLKTENHTSHSKHTSLMDDPLAAQLFLGRGVSNGEGVYPGQKIKLAMIAEQQIFGEEDVIKKRLRERSAIVASPNAQVFELDSIQFKRFLNFEINQEDIQEMILRDELREEYYAQTQEKVVERNELFAKLKNKNNRKILTTSVGTNRAEQLKGRMELRSAMKRDQIESINEQAVKNKEQKQELDNDDIVRYVLHSIGFAKAHKPPKISHRNPFFDEFKPEKLKKIVKLKRSKLPPPTYSPRADSLTSQEKMLWNLQQMYPKSPNSAQVYSPVNSIQSPNSMKTSLGATTARTGGNRLENTSPTSRSSLRRLCSEGDLFFNAMITSKQIAKEVEVPNLVITGSESVQDAQADVANINKQKLVQTFDKASAQRLMNVIDLQKKSATGNAVANTHKTSALQPRKIMIMSKHNQFRACPDKEHLLVSNFQQYNSNSSKIARPLSAALQIKPQSQSLSQQTILKKKNSLQLTENLLTSPRQINSTTTIPTSISTRTNLQSASALRKCLFVQEVKRRENVLTGTVSHVKSVSITFQNQQQ